jgi:ATP-dependent Clp protease ATP-binding subunit ClpA
MTTNAGAAEVVKKSAGLRPSRSRPAPTPPQGLFPPEFRNRLDAIMWFKRAAGGGRPASIVDKFLLELEHQLVERKVTLTATDAARQFFRKEGYSDEFGAREMGRVVQEHVKKPLAEEILFGALRDGGTRRGRLRRRQGRGAGDRAPRPPGARRQQPRRRRHHRGRRRRRHGRRRLIRPTRLR